MKAIVVGLLLIACVLVIGCSSTPSGPTEESLRNRAESNATAFSDGNWLKVHKFYLPEFQERCPSGEFAIFAGLGIAMLKGFIGIEEDENLDIKITSVSVDGFTGSVSSEILYDGEPIDFGDSEDSTGEEWVFINNQWWLADEECPSF